MSKHTGSKQKQTLKSTKSSENLFKRREEGFVLKPSQGIPVYNAETDPYCPRAQVRKYNNDRRIKAEEAASKGRRAEAWIKNTMQSKFDEPPVKFNPSLRTKAQQASASAGPESLAEVEILQKVIVRENLLAELQKLLHNQNDVSACLGEVVELVKAIRYQTVDIVEDIDSWQYAQPVPRPFLYRGINYLIKMFSDLNFLDVYEDIVEKFCFEFTSNPLAYRGGGDIATGVGGNARSTLVDKLSQQYNASGGNFDGIEVMRLRNAERTIQREFDRLDRGRQLFGHQSQQMLMAAASIEAGTVVGDGPSMAMAIGEAAFGSIAPGNSVASPYHGIAPTQYGAGSLENSQDYYQNQSVAQQQNHQQHQQQQHGQTHQRQNGGSPQHQHHSRMTVPKTDPKRKWRQKFSQRKVKLERIATLTEEANELRAMQTHIEEKVNALVEQHRAVVDKRKLAEGRRREALSFDREAAAQHLAVEISVHTADMQDINAKIKDLQRQNYFISIERNRKRKVVSKLKEEVELDRKRAVLEEKLADKIKEGGILNALKTLNQMQNKKLNEDLGMNNSSLDGSEAETNSLLDFVTQQANDLRSPESLPAVNYGGMESRPPKYHEQSSSPSYPNNDTYNDDNGGPVPVRSIYYQDESLDDDGDVEYLVEEGQDSSIYDRRLPSIGAGGGGDPLESMDDGGEWGAVGMGESETILAPGGALEDSVVEDPRWDAGESLEGDAGLPYDQQEEGQEQGEEEQEEEDGAGADAVMPSREKLSALLAAATGEEPDTLEAVDLPVGTAFSLAKARREGKMDSTDQFEGVVVDLITQEESSAAEAGAETRTADETTSPFYIADHSSSVEQLEPLVHLAYAAFSAGQYAETKLLTDTILKARRRLDLGPSPAILGTRYLVAEFYRSQGNFARAQDMYQKVLDLLASDGGSKVAGRDTLQIFALVGLADVHRNAARYEEAEASLHAAARFVASIAGTGYSFTNLPADKAHSLAVSELYASNGALSMTKSDYDESESYYSEALAARKATFGESHPRVGSILTQLSRIAWLRSRFPSALELCEKGLDMKRSLPEDHPSLAASLYWQATILRSLSKFAEATALAQQCLAIRLRVLDEEHAAVAQAHWLSSELLRDSGRSQEASEGYDKALKIRQRCFPKTSPEQHWHPSMFDSISSLASNAESQGRLLEALPLYEQALAMREEFYDNLGIPRHPSVALCQVHLARVKIALNKFDGVESLLSAAGRAIRQSLGSQHVAFSLFLHTLAMLYSQEGKFNLAHHLLERSQAVYKSNFAGTCQELGGHIVHPDYASVLLTSAENMLQPGCLSDAFALCDVVVEIMGRVSRACGGEAMSTPHTAHARYTRARLLTLLQRHEEAESELRDVLSLIRETIGEGSALHAAVLGEFGECLRQQGPDRAEEADGSLSSGLRARRLAFGSAHRLVSDSMRNISFLSLGRGQRDDALSVMRDGSLPLLEVNLGREHPETVWTSGQVGVMMLSCLTEEDHDTAPGESLLHSALDFLSVYTYGRFVSSHPWILRLGGFRPTEDGSAHATDESVSAVLGELSPELRESIDEWLRY